MKKLYIFALLLAVTACTKVKGPQYEDVCTSSHSEIQLVILPVSDGNGNVTLQHNYWTVEVCDSSVRACVLDDKVVDDQICRQKPKECDHLIGGWHPDIPKHVAESCRK